MLSLRSLVLGLIEKEILFKLVSITAPILDIKSIPKIQGTCNWSIKRQSWHCFFPFKTNSKLKQPFFFNSVPPAPQSLMDGDLAALLPLCKIWGLCLRFISVTELPVSNNALNPYVIDRNRMDRSTGGLNFRGETARQDRPKAHDSRRGRR